MTGRPISRQRQAALAAEELRKRTETKQAETTAEKVRMRGRQFEGHDPPMPASPSTVKELERLEKELTARPDELLNLADLWPKAHAALESILDDCEASAAAKVQAARIVQAARAAELAADVASRDTKIIFATSAYVGSEVV
jgi:hypothetical protein